MSRFVNNQNQAVEGPYSSVDGRGRKRASDNPMLPNSKRLQTEAEDVGENDLKRQSFVLPNADELEGYFSSFNTHELPPKITADPRKSNNPEDLRRMVKKIDKMLKESDFRPLEFRDIRYLSSKDFKDIFTHLLSIVYPEFKFKQKFEDEIPKLLKILNYPSADLFNSKMFYSIAPHSFYLFLNLLEFMVDNARRMRNHSAKEGARNSSSEDDSYLEEMSKLYMDFTITSYQHHLREEPIDDVVAQERSIQLESDNDKVLSDKEKFIEYCNTKKTKIEKYSTLYARINEQMQELSTKNEVVIEKVNQLKVMLKTRGISLEEMNILEEDRIQLETQSTNLEVRTDEVMERKKAVANKAQEIDNVIKSVFVRLRNEMTVQEHIEADVSLNELKRKFNMDESTIVDYLLDMSDDNWITLNDWSLQRRTHVDGKIDNLHILRTEIINKKEKYDEMEKMSRELAQKTEEKRNKSNERERVAKAEYNDNDQQVSIKDQQIVELGNSSDNSVKAHEQRMDAAHQEMVQLEYTDKARDSQLKEQLLGLNDYFKTLQLGVGRIANERESFSVEYSKSLEILNV
ncbi:hypothetical protein K501DRAFT_273607 [Backusella circina FSU 941]|nr:hypothetical protein K501DRAFT_273607 [Backusella circina FSU 941]